MENSLCYVADIRNTYTKDVTKYGRKWGGAWQIGAHSYKGGKGRHSARVNRLKHEQSRQFH